MRSHGRTGWALLCAAAIAGCAAPSGTPGPGGPAAWLVRARPPLGPDLHVSPSGRDGPGCGTATAPCRTIAGAHAIIRLHDDNGFATCAHEPARGCGRCAGGRVPGAPCNERRDCRGGVCSAASCSDDPSLPCATAADCRAGATCLEANPNARCPRGGCTGLPKHYTIHLAAGRYPEALAGRRAPPAPGFITYAGANAMIYSGAPCTFDFTRRTNVQVRDVSVQNWGDGDAMCTRGGAVASGAKGAGLVHWGAGWDFSVTGPGNRTILLEDVTTFGFGPRASSNSVRFEAWAPHCEKDPTRPCTADADCARGRCAGDPSGDLGVLRSFVQPGVAGGLAAVLIDGMACGFDFNVFLDSTVIQAADATALMLRQATCHPDTPWHLRDRLMATSRDLRIVGNSLLTGYAAPDVSLDVGEGTTLAVLGPTTYDACTRRVAGRLAYELPGIPVGGGPSFLGVLGCEVPPDPQDGELWYSAEAGEFRGFRRGRVVPLDR
jgi:hypothetical protein